MKTRVSLKYFVTGCLSKPYFDFKLTQTPSNVVSPAISVTAIPFKLFKFKVRVAKLQERAKICLNL